VNKENRQSYQKAKIAARWGGLWTELSPKKSQEKRDGSMKSNTEVYLPIRRRGGHLAHREGKGLGDDMVGNAHEESEDSLQLLVKRMVRGTSSDPGKVR